MKDSNSGLGQVRVWDCSRGRLATQSGGARFGHVTSLATSPACRWFVSGGCDNKLKVWAHEEGGALQAVETLSGHRDWVTCCAISRCSAHVLSGSRDCTLKLWRPSDFKCVTTLEGHEDFVNCCDFAACGQFAVSGCEDWSLKVTHARTHARTQSLPVEPWRDRVHTADTNKHPLTQALLQDLEALARVVGVREHA
jgi:WD40 repeat protein